MTSRKRLTIAHKLIGAFGIVILLGIISCTTVIVALRQYQHANETVGATSRSAALLAEHAITLFHTMDQATMGYVLTGQKSFLEQRESMDTAADSTHASLVQEVAKLPHHEKITEALNTAQEQDDANMGPVEDKMMDLLDKGKLHEAQALYHKEFAPALLEYTRDLQLISDQVRAYEAGVVVQTDNTANRMLIVSYILQALTVLLSFGVAIVIARSISARLNKLVIAARGLAAGDIEQEISSSSNDEVGDVSDAFRAMIENQRAMAATATSIANGDLSRDITPQSDRDVLGGAFAEMVTRLRELVSAVASNADNVALSASELTQSAKSAEKATESISATMDGVSGASDQSARGAGEIAQGSAVQAQSVAEAAGLIERLADSIKGVSQNAEYAAANAVQATEAAARGAEIVSTAVAGMANVKHVVIEGAEIIRSLEEASRRIGGIVETIDDIAKQTSLLALNAAIESARAGEAGRGFAVVADEVRKLAHRTGIATQEIGTLIHDVQSRTIRATTAMTTGTEEVERQSIQTQKAGEALCEIEVVARKVMGGIEDICVMGREMAILSKNAANSMNEVSAVVEENSAASEEMSASAEEVATSIQSVSYDTGRQTASIAAVTDAAERLMEMSTNLQAVVSGFKILPAAQVKEFSIPARRAA